VNNSYEHPFAEKPERDLTQDEWRVLVSWRLKSVEKRLDSIAKGMWTIAGGIIVGVLVIWLTSGLHP
jgi:hypothetical protein